MKIFIIIMFIVLVNCSSVSEQTKAWVDGYTYGWNAHEKYEHDSVQVIDSLLNLKGDQ